MRISRNNRGAAYVLALVTMLVGSVLALAMLQAANSYYLGESSRTKKSAAMDLAQAGVDYAYWQVHYKAQPLPYSANVTLDTGSFNVEATDDGARDRSTMLITSTGTCGTHKFTVKRVTLGPLPYHYAWCENGKIETSMELNCNSQNRGIRANDSITINNYSNSISQGVWSTGTITARGYVTPQYSSSPPIAFPDIDYSYYSSIATNTYYSSVTFTSLSYASDTVLYVNGNAVVNLNYGVYRGGITIVATGNITVNSNLINNNSNSYLALITSKTITLQLGAQYVVAAFYAHKSDNSGRIVLQGQKTIVGTIASDDVLTDNSCNFWRDSGMNLDVMRRLSLPGL